MLDYDHLLRERARRKRPAWIFIAICIAVAATSAVYLIWSAP